MNRATLPFQNAKKSVPIVLNVDPKCKDVKFIDKPTLYLLDTEPTMEGWRRAENGFESDMKAIIYDCVKRKNRWYGRMKKHNELADVLLKFNKTYLYYYIVIYEDVTIAYHIYDDEGWFAHMEFNHFNTIELRKEIRIRKIL